MLDFVCELDRVMGKWPENVSWTIAQLADYTQSTVPQVVDVLSDTLDREFEVHESLTHADAKQALSILKERLSGQLAAREKRQAERREKAIRSYDVTMDKMRVLQAAKNHRAAYRTLSYYVGRHEKDVPADLLPSLYGECLRLGAKAEANLQELSMWLRKGVMSCAAAGTPEGLEDAIDFVDAYSDLFADSADMRARRLLDSVLGGLKQQAAGMSLEPRVVTLMEGLQRA